MLNRYLKTGLAAICWLVSTMGYAQQTGRVLLVTQPPPSVSAKTVKTPVVSQSPSRTSVAEDAKGAASDPMGALAKKSTAYFLKAGDPLIVYLRGIPDEQQIEDIIDENGFINLPFIGRIQADEKTSSALELEIEKTYTEQQIYKHLTVSVIVPTRSYYVRGEVRAPGRFPLMSGISVVQAIAASGGYTDFADPTKVTVVRAGKKIYVNMRELEKHPEKDMDVEAGDVIIISRSFF